MSIQTKVNDALKSIQTKVKNDHNELEVSFGNSKLGSHTLIINMGTAMDCPSAKLGMCNAINSGAKCYALKAEQLYANNVPDYRHRQFSYWRKNTGTKIANDIIAKIGNRSSDPIKYVRFNEAGDFWDQEDITKLNVVAKKLKNFGIIVYGYSARKDLDFSKALFLVKGSGHDKGNNGRTEIISKDDPIPEDFKLCPGSCKSCNLCMVNKKFNIAFRKH